jgi:hypothetical protein
MILTGEIVYTPALRGYTRFRPFNFFWLSIYLPGLLSPLGSINTS